MTKLDDIISSAKDQFLKQYKTQLIDLGYNLACGVTIAQGSYAICANVYYPENTLHEAAQKQAYGLLPTKYSFSGRKIPVDIRMVPDPKPRKVI